MKFNHRKSVTATLIFVGLSCAQYSYAAPKRCSDPQPPPVNDEMIVEILSRTSAKPECIEVKKNQKLVWEAPAAQKFEIEFTNGNPTKCSKAELKSKKLGNKSRVKCKIKADAKIDFEFPYDIVFEGDERYDPAVIIRPPL